MGCFDSVFIGCPKCKEPLEFQAKLGKCRFDKFLSNAVPPVVAYALDGDVETCSCGETVKLKLAKPMPDAELVVDSGEDI